MSEDKQLELLEQIAFEIFDLKRNIRAAACMQAKYMVPVCESCPGDTDSIEADFEYFLSWEDPSDVCGSRAIEEEQEKKDEYLQELIEKRDALDDRIYELKIANGVLWDPEKDEARGR